MATLSIINNFETTIKGSAHSAKQGTDPDAATTDPFEVEIGEAIHDLNFTLATATAQKVWDDDTHTPLAIEYFYFKADQDCYLQVIGAATNFIVVVTAGIPFTFTGNTMLAAADTTAISGSAPSVAEIDSIVVQNNSGTTANCRFAVV